MSVIWETQKAIYEKLTDDATLMALINGVYDHVPERTEFPYLTIGDIRGEDSSKLGSAGYNLYVSIAVHSRKHGRKEALEISERIKTLLSGEVLIDGYSVSQLKLIEENSSLLRGAETYQVNQEYKIMIFAS